MFKYVRSLLYCIVADLVAFLTIYGCYDAIEGGAAARSLELPAPLPTNAEGQASSELSEPTFKRNRVGQCSSSMLLRCRDHVLSICESVVEHYEAGLLALDEPPRLSPSILEEFQLTQKSGGPHAHIPQSNPVVEKVLRTRFSSVGGLTFLLAEGHVFMCFLQEGTSTVRLRLAIMLCVYYGRIGLWTSVFKIMQCLHRVGVLGQAGVRLRGPPVEVGGVQFDGETLGACWTAVLAEVLRVRALFEEYSFGVGPFSFAERATGGETVVPRVGGRDGTSTNAEVGTAVSSADEGVSSPGRGCPEAKVKADDVHDSMMMFLLQDEPALKDSVREYFNGRGMLGPQDT